MRFMKIRSVTGVTAGRKASLAPTRAEGLNWCANS